PSASVLGLHALALSLGANGLLVAGLSSSTQMLPGAVAEIGIGAAAMVACEAVRRLYGATPRPALLFAFLFLLVAGMLGFESIRSEAPVRVVYTSMLVALTVALTTVRVARARDPAAEPIRRLLVIAGFTYTLVWIARSAVAFHDPFF